ncbi:MAG: hypothetical protein HQ522_00870 [Bacteroidetes bacterium]|nr:hypothetical protein [Bacteroidota bacterium]
MNSKIKILFLLVFGFCYLVGNSQKINNELALFTDRDYCISGDSVWFKVFLPETVLEKGNVVRVQLDTKDNNLISSAVKRIENGWAEGYLHVPDSLSSGLCFVTAFLNSQRDSSSHELYSNALIVYNRFEESISEMELPNSDLKTILENYNSFVNLNSDKNEYLTREKVSVEIDINSDEILNAVIKATVVDPLAKEISGSYRFNFESLNNTIPRIKEQDGFLLNGRVVDIDGNLQKGVLVVLSITGEPPYFDYYISGKDGDFHFFIKDAVGTANIVLQAISKNNKEYFIEKELNYLVRKDENQTLTKTLTSQQSEFISSLIDGDFIYKLFNLTISKSNEFFEISPRFSMPFYGPPTERIVPDEFMDLPDFKEISRELLGGVQLRDRNGSVTFRMLNQKQRYFFENEPLRLLNGIPVFKNSFFTSLKSTDINYIDVVQSERLFGDLVFMGILSVSLKDKSNSWMVKQPNIFQFKVDCLQPGKRPEYLKERITSHNQPDLRHIYIWEILKINTEQKLDFYLSDLKGKVEISVEGVTKSKKVFKASKIIEVK